MLRYVSNVRCKREAHSNKVLADSAAWLPLNAADGCLGLQPLEQVIGRRSAPWTFSQILPRSITTSNSELRISFAGCSGLPHRISALPVSRTSRATTSGANNLEFRLAGGNARVLG